MIGSLFLLHSCKKFTDITPKGKNLLQKVDELETILNFNFNLNGSVQAGSAIAQTTAENAFVFDDINLLINDHYTYLKNVNTEIAAQVKTLDYAFITGDETVNRAGLAATDIKYSKMYFIVNNVANVVIANADNAIGDRTKANQLKAEAYMIRAWMHYLLVNIYAKAYHKNTAANDSGIPYVKEGIPITEPNKKFTVAEVYANILADIDAAFQLNGLPRIPVNSMRAGQGFAYAAKARVLISMGKYDEALTAANQSLEINSAVDDHRRYAPVGAITFAHPAVSGPEELFFAVGGPPYFRTVTVEIVNNYYEPGDIIKNYVNPYIDFASFIGVPGGLTWFTTTYNRNTAGLNTSDTYLMKAECLIRAGGVSNIAAAMQIINYLRERRIHPSVYAALTATTEAQAFAILKKFSRIEFLSTIKNFLNIKRWNTEDGYKETISRTINGVTYQLKPESKLWIFPFPQNATDYNPNLSQNF